MRPNLPIPMEYQESSPGDIIALSAQAGQTPDTEQLTKYRRAFFGEVALYHITALEKLISQPFVSPLPHQGARLRKNLASLRDVIDDFEDEDFISRDEFRQACRELANYFKDKL
jgi:hypothetical protein